MPAAALRATGARNRESAAETETAVAVRGGDVEAAAAAVAVAVAVAVAGVHVVAPIPSLVSAVRAGAIALALVTGGPEGDLARVVTRRRVRSGRNADQTIVKSRRAPSPAASSSAACRR